MWDWKHTKLPDFKSISDIPLDSVDCTVNIANEIFSILESSNVSRSDIKEINKMVDKVCEELGPNETNHVDKYFEFTHQQKSEIDMLFRIFLWAVESLKKTCKIFGTEYDINKLNQLKFKINFFQKKLENFELIVELLVSLINGEEVFMFRVSCMNHHESCWLKFWKKLLKVRC